MDSNFFDIGIFGTTLMPNLVFHTALALPTYLVARSTNFVEAKDILWSSGQVANAWYSSVGRHVQRGAPLNTVLRSLTKPGVLLLTGVTIWGGRLFYRVASRAIGRGADDSRYTAVKKEAGFWNQALFTLFLPEAITQAVISLPFTAPFRDFGPVLACPADAKPWIEALAIAAWGTGMAIEVLADSQLAAHQQRRKSGMCKEGVWSIVRHPNVQLFRRRPDTRFLPPATLLSLPPLPLGPPRAPRKLVLPPVRLRRQGERTVPEERYARTNPEKKVDLDVYRLEKNAFWPSVRELGNTWTWVVVGMGVLAVGVERVVEMVLQ